MVARLPEGLPYYQTGGVLKIVGDRLNTAAQQHAPTSSLRTQNIGLG